MNGYDWRENLPPEQAGAVLSAAERVETGRKKMRRVLGDHLNAAVICVLLLLQILLPFVTAGVCNPLTPDYLFNTALSVSSTLIGWYMFVPDGRRDRAALPDYAAAASRWAALSRDVEQNRLVAFRDYCRDYARAEQRRAVENRLTLLENAGVARETFFEKWQSAPRRAVARAKRQGALTKEQYKLVLLCRRPVPERPISPNFVLFACAAGATADAVRENSSYERKAMILKPVLCLFWVIAMGFFFPERRENVNALSVVSQVAVRIFLVCLSLFSGYRTGYRAAEYRMADIRGRVTFLEEFAGSQTEKEANA